MMQYTGERYMPLIEELGHPSIAFHNERYELAALFCHGKRVLELGCGSGYGAEILARVASKVVASDNSREAIEYSKEHYAHSNISWHVDDICTPSLARMKWFDVVVAYEVLEHIEDGNGLMELMKNAVLSFTGMGFISTPAPVAHGSAFHIHEYDLEEFENLLSTHFRKYVILSHRPGTFSFNLEGAHTYVGIVWNG